MAFPMTYSPKALAQLAVSVARQALSAYGSRYSRHDYTQAQFFALLVLKTFFQTSYRGLIAIVKDFAELQEVLDLKKIPHFTAVQKAATRLEKKGLMSWSSTLCLAVPALSWAPTPKASSMPRAWKAATSARTTAGNALSARKPR
jgi:hypothetical protein